jgi:glycosyltransferase involved in cell wall biosynthesis
VKNPAISICIPVYNGAKYLAESIHSALSQSFPHFEVIIIDDGSIDDSWKIIQDFAKKSEKIRAFQNKRNLGLVGNWNACVAKAEGTWIKFLFQDDTMVSSCLHDMISCAVDSKKEFILCEREFLIEQNASETIREYYQRKVKRLESVCPNGGIISSSQICAEVSKYLNVNFIGEPCSFLFKKSLTQQYGLFNDQLDQLCDFEFAVRIGVNQDIYYTTKRLISFRVHGNSTSESNHTKKKLKIQLLDNFLLAYSYRHYRHFKNLMELHPEAIRSFYQKREALLFSNGYKIALELTLPLFRNYPKLSFVFIQYLIKRKFLHVLKWCRDVFKYNESKG